MSAENKAKSDSNASTSKACDNRPSPANKSSDTTPTKTTRTQFNESIYIETEFLPSAQSSSQLQTVESMEQNVGNIPKLNYNFEVSFIDKHQRDNWQSYQINQINQ